MINNIMEVLMSTLREDLGMAQAGRESPIQDEIRALAARLEDTRKYVQGLAELLDLYMRPALPEPAGADKQIVLKSAITLNFVQPQPPHSDIYRRIADLTDKVDSINALLEHLQGRLDV